MYTIFTRCFSVFLFPTGQFTSTCSFGFRSLSSSLSSLGRSCIHEVSPICSELSFTKSNSVNFFILSGCLVTQTLPAGLHRKNSCYCVMPQECYKNTSKSPKQPFYSWILVITLHEISWTRRWKLAKQHVICPLKDGRWSAQYMYIRQLPPKLCTENSFHSQSPCFHITTTPNLSPGWDVYYYYICPNKCFQFSIWLKDTGVTKTFPRTKESTSDTCY